MYIYIYNIYIYVYSMYNVTKDVIEKKTRYQYVVPRMCIFTYIYILFFYCTYV